MLLLLLLLLLLIGLTLPRSTLVRMAQTCLAPIPSHQSTRGVDVWRVRRVEHEVYECSLDENDVEVPGGPGLTVS